ncbi:MAG: NAD(P)H-dependent oxidoreductase [Gammaproteobacteria bacterium]
MTQKIAIVVGHPDPGGNRFCHALAQTYSEGAEAAGHQVKSIDIAQIDFPVLRSKEDFDRGTVPEAIQPAQEIIRWADHLVFFYPLWLGTMPAYFKAFMEQTFRPGFAAGKSGAGKPWSKLLIGKSARVVITMGMPAFVYRWFYQAHSLKSLERNILGFCGIGPIKETLIGMVDALEDHERRKWLLKMRQLGEAGM